MFNKLLYNRGLFDRAKDFGDGTNVTTYLVATGDFIPRPTIIYPFEILSTTGVGELNVGLVLLVNSYISPDGIGEFESNPYVLELALSIGMDGSSSFLYDLVLKTPLSGTMDGAVGLFESTKSQRLFHVIPIIKGESTISTGDIVVGFNVDTTDTVNGSGEFTGSNFILGRPLPMELSGSSTFYLRVLTLDEDIFELDELSFAPGSTITIDTDLMTVLIDGVENVTRITEASEFFELGVGENEISYILSQGGDSSTEIEVTYIYENRWL